MSSSIWGLNVPGSYLAYFVPLLWYRDWLGDLFFEMVAMAVTMKMMPMRIKNIVGRLRTVATGIPQSSCLSLHQIWVAS